MSLDINDKLYVEANGLLETPNLACNDVIAKEDNNQQQERISKMPRLVCQKENKDEQSKKQHHQHKHKSPVFR